MFYLLILSKFLLAKKIYIFLRLKTFIFSVFIYVNTNLNKLSIEYQSYQMSTKIDAFEQKICNITALMMSVCERRVVLSVNNTLVCRAFLFKRVVSKETSTRVKDVSKISSEGALKFPIFQVNLWKNYLIFNYYYYYL